MRNDADLITVVSGLVTGLILYQIKSVGKSHEEKLSF